MTQLSKLSFFMKITAIAVVFLLYGATTFATNYSSIQNGNWDNPATWGGGFPVVGDNVTINHLVTVNIASACNDLTITSTGTGQLEMHANLTVGGNLTLMGSGTLNVNSSTLNVIGNLVNNETLALTTGTLNVGGNLINNSLLLGGSSTINVTLLFDNTNGTTDVTNVNLTGTSPTGGTIVGLEDIWQAPGVWSSGTAPTSGDDATIDYIYNNATNIDCNNLTINAGASLQVQPGSSVTVNGDLTNNGSLILVAPNNLTASGSLITLGGITNNGTMQAERFIAQGRWHLIANPMINSILAPNLFLGDYIYNYLEPVGTNNNDSWAALTMTDNINVGTGYLVKTPTIGGKKVVFNGDFNTLDVTISGLLFSNPTASAKGYNLVANPFPSAFNWDDASLIKTNIDNTIWIWNNTVYEVYDGVVGTPPSRTGFIPAMQGFFVKANAAGGSLTVTNVARVNNTTSFSKNEVPNLISLTTSGNDLSDAVALYFYNDNADSKKFMTSTVGVPQIYAIENNESLAIDGLQDVKAQQDVNLGFVCDISGTYTITANEFNFSDATTIVLEDLKTGTLTSLSKDKIYSFNYEAGETESRFVLHFNYSPMNVSNITNNISIFANEKNIYINNIENQNGTVNVYNVLGKKVLTSDVKSVISTNLNTGVYMVELIINNNKLTNKIIIN